MKAGPIFEIYGIFVNIEKVSYFDINQQVVDSSVSPEVTEQVIRFHGEFPGGYLDIPTGETDSTTVHNFIVSLFNIGGAIVTLNRDL